MNLPGEPAGLCPPPRVIQVTASLWPDSGGIARHVYQLVRGRPPGSSLVVVPSHDDRCRFERQEGIPVLRVPRQAVIHSEPTGVVILGLGLRLRRLLAGYDLLHAHLPFPMLAAQAPLLPAALPMVISFHNEISQDVAIPRPLLAVHAVLQRRMLQRARAIIVGTADYADACPSLRGLQSRRRVVPYGIDADTFTFEIPSPSERAGDLLLFVGRLAYYKGLHVLLSALSRLQGVRLVVVGDGPEGPALRTLAARLGLCDRVTWCGHVTDAELLDLYRTATALVLPSTSISESFGLVQLEAHACGLPVVSSELPGVRMVNPDGVTGLHARLGDAVDLARVLHRLLGDPALRTRLGATAWQRVRTEFGVAAMADRIEQIYCEVLHAGGLAER